jgi:hypothetical protein
LFYVYYTPISKGLRYCYIANHISCSLVDRLNSKNSHD